MSAVINESFAKTKLCKELGMSMSGNRVGQVKFLWLSRAKGVITKKVGNETTGTASKIYQAKEEDGRTANTRRTEQAERRTVSKTTSSEFWQLKKRCQRQRRCSLR